MSDNPRSTATRVLGIAALAACSLFGVVASAAASTTVPAGHPASQGSVPSEVARYAADPDGLVARLDDLFGVTTSGRGIEFGDTTEVGQLNRAWVFTEAWMSGGSSDDPVELTNLWTAPILIDEKPIGLATIWINPATEAPDLADFDRSASSATALMDVPSETQLVRDEPHAAWFTLAEGQLTPLVAGDSGVAAPTSVTAYQRTFTDAEPPPATAPQPEGLLGAAIVAGAAVLVVLAVLLLPMLRRRAGDPDPDEGLGVSTAAVTLPSAAQAPAPKQPERKTVANAEQNNERNNDHDAEPDVIRPEGAAKAAADANPGSATRKAASPRAAKTTTRKPGAAKTTTPKPGAARTTAPKTSTPSATSPKTPPPKAAPRTTAPRATAPKTTASKTTASKTTASKTTAPKTTTPKATAPKAPAPKPPARTPAVRKAATVKKGGTGTPPAAAPTDQDAPQE